MKLTSLFILALTAIGPYAAAQADVLFNYTYSQPLRKMGTVINQINGVNAQVLFPLAQSRYSLGGDIGYHRYAGTKNRQNHVFNGAPTVIDTRVTTSILTIGAVGRADLVMEGDVVPYLMGQTGVNIFWTDLGLANKDPRGCQPRDIRTVFSSAALTLTGGAGMRFYLGEIGGGMDKKRIYLDLSVHYAHGGRVRFINTDISGQHAHPQHSGTGDHSVYHYSTFIQPDTREVHTHPVGTMHTAPVRMMLYKVGVGYRLPSL